MAFSLNPDWTIADQAIRTINYFVIWPNSFFILGLFIEFIEQ